MENIGNNNKTYRIRTSVDSADSKLDVQLTQHFDILEILSLKIKPTNFYQLQQSNYGVVVGRVVANGGFGVPNVKVSVFIPFKDGAPLEHFYRYSYTAVSDLHNGIRYNILPDEVDKSCHQDIGTLPSKTYMLDNDVMMEVFADYYKLTTSTNASGDYMLFGVPTGDQLIHMDVDLSDIGLLSQTPRDMMYKGYNANLFDSPTKFKGGSDLDSLPQLQSQTKSVYVYPYWGETNELRDNIAITRCDIKLAYEFEPTCIFMGSTVTDRASNAIGKKCVATDDCGKMSELTASEGSIEMIRYNINGNIEEYPIMGNRLIDGDGVWCYQIPMNLDYVTTDEFGNTIPTDDPTKGIPTRTKVRFRIAMDDTGDEGVGRKKARYLVPHNPATEKDVDYNFGTFTDEKNFVDLLWNKVYSVKNYIPRIEKSRKASKKRISKTREHTGIKGVNHGGDNNPIPYNNITLKLNFAYKFRCILLKSIIMFMVAFNTMSWFTNVTLVNVIVRPITTIIKAITYIIPGGKKLRKKIEKIETAAQIPYVTLDPEFCMVDDEKPILYVPIAVETKGVKKRVMEETAYKETVSEYGKCEIKIVKASNFDETELSTCIEVQLAEENEVVFYNFYNDWLNGNLYFPLWFRKLRKSRKLFFGLITTKGIDRWCQDDKQYKITQRETCDENGATKLGRPLRKITSNGDFKRYTSRYTNEAYAGSRNEGLVHVEKTMLDELVYYYNANWFKTDIILLGSLDEYDRNGIPQFFKYLPITTYQKPNTVPTTDIDDENVIEMSGENWSLEQRGPDYYSTGLFYQLGCLDANTLMLSKTCFNVKRVCELGVDLDQRYYEEDGTVVAADGLITQKNIANHDARAMFATMNDYTSANPRLSVVRNTDTSMMEYQLLYSYGKEFDGVNWGESVSFNKSYRDFRGGYENGINVRDRKNSFYFYFGLHEGKTAIEKFNSQYYSNCGITLVEEKCVVKGEVSDWCETTKANKMVFTLSKDISYPINIMINEDGSDDVEVFRVEEKDLLKNSKSNHAYTWIYPTDKYADYEVTVTDVEDLVVYSSKINLYPDSVRATLKVMPFNVNQDNLKKLLPQTKNDGSKITYNKGLAYGDGAVFSIYNDDEKYGYASRIINANGKKCEVGGGIALTLDEGKSFDNAVITIKGDFTADGVEYTYNKVYDKTNKPIIRQLETVNNDGSVTTTDVACLYVPYGDVEYNITVDYKCENGMTNTVANQWNGKVKVGSYTAPIITFNGSDGYSLTWEQIEGLFTILGEVNLWENVIDKGGILDLTVNEGNVYYQILYGIYKDSDNINNELLQTIAELEAKTVIVDSMSDDEKEAIQASNENIEKNNVEKLKNLLYSFYHIFTRTTNEDGITITCDNTWSDLTVEHASYRSFTYTDTDTTWEIVTKDLTLDEFNSRFGDFTTEEAVLYGFVVGAGSNTVHHTYQLDKNKYGLRLHLDDPLNKNSGDIDFHLFDKRMQVDVVVNNCIYKYVNDSEVDVEKTYRGWMSIKVTNGFHGFEVVNDMYDNWVYKDGYLYPVGSDGTTAIETDLCINNSAYDTLKHRFNLPASYDESVLIIRDGVNNLVTISNTYTAGECGLGFGGLLSFSTTHTNKAELKTDYANYKPTMALESWKKCKLEYNGDKVTVSDVSEGSMGNTYSTTYNSENGLAVSGYFINCLNYIDISMVVTAYSNMINDVSRYTTASVKNVVFCDKVSFVTGYLTLKTGSETGCKPVTTHEDGMYQNDGVAFPMGRDDIDYGYYYTWGVSYEQDGEGWNKFYDVLEQPQGFYIDKKFSNGGDYYMAQYDEGEEINDVIIYNDNAQETGKYKFYIQDDRNRCSEHRVHWIQRISDVYQDMWLCLNMSQANVPLYVGGVGSISLYDFLYSGYMTNDTKPCIYSPENYEKYVETRFIWLDWKNAPITGLPRNMHNLGMQNNANYIIGVLLTTGKDVGRYVIMGQTKNEP